MNLLIATDTCSYKKNDEIEKKRIRKIIDPQQKFFRLFIEGLSCRNDVLTTVVSSLPVSASTIEQRKFSYEEESIGSVTYKYIPFINGKFLRYITVFFSSLKYAKKWCKENANTESAVIVDPLVPIVAIPTRLIAQRLGFEVGAIVTDIPSMSTNMKGRKNSGLKDRLVATYQSIADKDLLKYDFYIPLTESLNDVANIHHRPYCVIEGFADGKDTEISLVHQNYIMYAGGVYEKFGVKNLVEAFLTLDLKDIELWIFGEGPYTEEIVRISKEHKNVIYKGCVTSEEVVDFEKKALLLVNPRPTNEEFAKYSFPSKTMEYLLSGTATVSTKLSGIPLEYFEHMFFFEDDSKQTIADTLKNLVDMPREELLKKGVDGHNFVIENKNNTVMTRKVMNLIVQQCLSEIDSNGRKR